MSTAKPEKFRLRPMRPRNPGEEHRAASTLELFFDLVFVVAVSIASVNLHEMLSEGHVAHGLGSYAMVFFAIWWAWMNFTWFATSFDTDDWLYRTLTVVQMAGVLVLAAGVGPAFTEGDMRILVAGYVVMRIAMVLQWLRASRCGGAAGRAALGYAVGIVVVQALWVGWLLVPAGPLQTILFLVFGLCELAVPVLAENLGRTPWHPEHITERYGLFTLILMGESLLASANAIIEALHEDESVARLMGVAAMTLLVSAGMWWIYFWAPHHRSITSFGKSLRYGYVHYFVFAAVGAFSAGIEVEIGYFTGHSELGPVATSLSVAIPVAVFVLGIWWISMRDHADRVVNTAMPLGALAVLGCAILPFPTALVAVVVVAMVVVLVVRQPVPEVGSDGE